MKTSANARRIDTLRAKTNGARHTTAIIAAYTLKL